MAEITKKIIIEQAAIDAPLEFSGNIDVAKKSLKEFIALCKQADIKIKGADSVGKLKKEVDNLALAEVELLKISKQIATEEARSTEAYQKQAVKLGELRTAIKNKNAMTSEQARTVTALNSSLLKLDQALKKNRDDYAKLTTEEARNSKEGRALLKVIQDQDKASKELSKSLGQSQKNVGNYESAAQGMQMFSNSTVTAVSSVKQLGKELLALAKNPWFIILTTALAIFESLKAAANAFYTGTAEGGEVLREQEIIWDGYFARVKKGFGEMSSSGVKFFNDFKEWFVEGNLRIFSKQAGDDFKKAVETAKALAKEIESLQKEHMRDVVDDANTEKLVSELMEKTKDKLHQTDIERLESLREARKLLEEQSKGDLDLANRDLETQRKILENLGGKVNRQKSIAQYTDDEFRALGANQEQIKKLVELEAAKYKVEADIAAKKKALNKQEFQMVEDIRKANQDRLDRAVEGQRKYENTVSEGFIKVRDRLIDREELGLDERLKLLQENLNDRRSIIDNNEKSELMALERSVEERIRAEGKPFSKKILEQDEGFMKARLAILEKHNHAVEEETQYNVDTLTKIYSTEYVRINEELKDQNKEQIRIFQEGFADGLFTLNQYNRAIKETNEKANDEQYNTDVAFLEKVIAARKKSGLDTLMFEDMLAKVRQDRAKEEADKLLALETQLQQKKQEIRSSAFNFLNTLGDRFTQKETDRLDRQLEELNYSFEQQIKAAGDNEKAKDRLQAEHDRKEKEIEKEKRRLQRQQAIFEKTIAIAQATINTAVAVTKNIAFPPLAIATAALGALEIATILATPLPAAEHGTEFHKGGLIRVSEKGPELAILPNRKMMLTPADDSVVNLPRGTKIKDNPTTMQLLAYSGMRPDTLGTAKDAELNNKMLDKLDNIDRSIRASRSSSFINDGIALVETLKANDTHYQKIRHTNLGKWVK